MVGGLSFLTKIPPKLECLQFSAQKMHSSIEERHLSWKACTHEEICAEHMTPDMYRPIQSEQEYFDNWVPKFDLMCKSTA